MKTRTPLALVLLALLAASARAAESAPAATPTKLPYVYTRWKHFTVSDGLPNDHIFAVKVDGPRVWVGTEDGLALVDKPSGKVVKTWQEKDGLPFKVVTGIDVDPKTGDVWLALFGGGLARLSGAGSTTGTSSTAASSTTSSTGSPSRTTTSGRRPRPAPRA